MARFEGETREYRVLRDRIRVLRERWWVIVLAVVIGGGAAFAVSHFTTPLYEASSNLLYQKTQIDTALLGTELSGRTATDPSRIIYTFGLALMKDTSIAEGVKAQLGSSRSAAKLQSMIRASNDSNTNMVTVYAVSPHADEATVVANAFADQFILYRQKADENVVATAMNAVKRQMDGLSALDLKSEYGLMLEEKYETLRILESVQDGGFSVVSRAVIPSAPFTPRTNRNIIVGVVVGLLAGFILAFLLDYLDSRIKDEDTLEREAGVPVLASVPAAGGRWRGGKGERSDRPIGFGVHQSLLEPFRTLRSSLHYFSLGKPSPVWLVTSGLPQEGKTVTAVNLALSIALSGKRVILVESDMRRPMVHEYLGLDRDPGLSDVLAGTKTATDVLQVVYADEFLPPSGRRQAGELAPGLLQSNFYVLTSGPLPPNPSELLASDQMGAVIRELAGTTDCLVIDSPPVLVVSDALSVAEHVDGVIIVARLHSTTRSELRAVRSRLERTGSRVIGTIAGGARQGQGYYRKRGYGRYSYYHGHSDNER